MFRFLSRNYSWVLADLGRNLNPASWAFIQNLDELFLVTAPDVLALYQTRSILQTLAGRGFDKGRLHLVLNRNRKGPRDFWIESIRKMFEMDVIAVIPEDAPTLEKLPKDRFEFPAASPFGRAVGKLAARLKSREEQAGQGKEQAGRKTH
jgi:Flp pilus assembly CpaE family ATPase